MSTSTKQNTTTDEPTTAQKAVATALIAPRAVVRALANAGSAVVSLARKYGWAVLSFVILATIAGFIGYWSVALATAVAASFVLPGTAGYYFLAGVVLFIVFNIVTGASYALQSAIA